MAILFPTFENISRLKVQPTEGEYHLLNYLVKELSDDVEVYFQPFLQGDRPDIILLEKNVGATIIEVKDWNLERYKIDIDNKWHLKSNNHILRSPYQQVFKYKNNMFNVHIIGMLEKKTKNKIFYGRIKPYVYFHNATKNNLKAFYDTALQELKQLENKNNNNYKVNNCNYMQYEKKRKYLKKKEDKLKRDLDYYSVGSDNLNKILLPANDAQKLFDEGLYKEFQRHLKPPVHTLEEGKDIVYTKEQDKYSKSSEVHEKIRGVAGSGKTTLLAKRAVNAHKRHGQKVLILTYNLTLRSYIKDKISDVRENFSWGNFFIVNYHEFFKRMANDIDKSTKALSDFDDFNFFNGFSSETQRYKTIIIDETQDYKPEWIKIIRKYFLEKNDGEIVLFGDEKQNIYERSLDENKRFTTPQGFGKWKGLKKSIRQQAAGGRILNLSKKFQSAFFRGRYDIDELEVKKLTPSLDLDIFKISNYSIDDYSSIASSISDEIKNNKIHNNDIVILSSDIELLQNIEQIMRKKYGQKTITTFETIEMNRMIRKGNNNPTNEIEDIRRNKKIAFNLNSGKMKLSTVHSFKGFEADTVFLILNKNDEYKNGDEIVYTAITRSKHNLLIFSNPSSKYNEFFSQELYSGSGIKKSTSMLEDLKLSIATKQFIDLYYSQHNKIIEFKNVKPYKVLFMNDNYYLACEVDNKYKFSMFRVSKIDHIKRQEKEFYPDTDIQEFVSDIQTPFSKYQEDYKVHLVDVKVEVDQSKAYFFESKDFLASQKILETKENGNLIISYKITQELEIEELIKKWIPYIKVLEPLTLEEKIKIDLEKYLAK